MYKNLLLVSTFAFFLLSSCEQTATKEQEESAAYPTTGSIERMDDRMNSIIAEGAEIEILADSFQWSEGPVWIGGADGFVVFTDVPQNKAWKWNVAEGLTSYLDPSGYTGPQRDGSMEGANGLRLDAEGNLVLCQHGDRRVARMTASTDQPASMFETIADNWQGKRFNSPNDLVYDETGMLYFTDPPYGLQYGTSDTINREISFQGVYSVMEGEEVQLVDSTMTRPNGIALSPDGSRLYVANSDPQRMMWKVFERQDDGTFGNGQVFLDVTNEVSPENKGSADGLRVLTTGELIATGPGGVWVIAADGTPLGRVRTGQRTANCEIGADGYLYMTAHMQLMRVKMERR